MRNGGEIRGPILGFFKLLITPMLSLVLFMTILAGVMSCGTAGPFGSVPGTWVERHRERILVLKMVLGDRLLNAFSVYAPHTGKPGEEKGSF